MDNTSVSNYFTLIKQQFSLQEQLRGHHLKIESLIGLMLTRDLLTYKTAKLQHALLVVCDLNNSVIKLSEAAMNNFIAINALLTNPEAPPFSWH
ncbi:MAG TPA: hypothetical protein VNK03_04070 [Gammaproteobacteria bacterium]|nr:hypothetical protein [Gammaproteobacteria bacterium]